MKELSYDMESVVAVGGTDTFGSEGSETERADGDSKFGKPSASHSAAKRPGTMRRSKGEYSLKTHWVIQGKDRTVCGKIDMPQEVLQAVGTEVTCRVCPKYLGAR